MCSCDVFRALINLFAASTQWPATQNRGSTKKERKSKKRERERERERGGGGVKKKKKCRLYTAIFELCGLFCL